MSGYKHIREKPAWIEHQNWLYEQNEDSPEQACLEIIDQSQGFEEKKILKYKDFVLKVLSFLKQHQYNITIVFVSETVMAQKNHQFKKKKGSTDVLTFITRENPLEGDILICLEKVEENAHYFGQSFLQELKMVTVHSILHLMGWTHQSKEATEPMLMKQKQILDALEQ